MAQIRIRNSANVKIEPLELSEPMEEVDRVVNSVGGLAHVKVEGGCVRPDERAAFSSRVKTEEGFVTTGVKVEEGYIAAEEGDDDDAVVESSAVLKAKRLALPRAANRIKQRRMYRPAGRQKYGVDRDSALLSTYHRSKLRRLLSALIQQRKWHRAAGVLGVLLGIPFACLKPRNVEGCWSDFAAAMEVFRRIDCVGSNDLKVRRMFRLLLLRQPNARSRGKVQLELALYLMSTGNREAAYNELRPIVDGKHYREDPVANLCHGVNSYQLWYEKAVEEVSRMEVTETVLHTPSQGSDPIEGIGENDDDQNIQPEWRRTVRERFGDGFGFSNSQLSGAATQDNKDAMQLEDAVELDVNIWQASQKSIYEETDEQGFVQTGEEFWRSVIVPCSQGLDRRLFPIQVPREIDQKHYVVPMKDGRTRDLHAAAVKHLKQALASAPDMLPALLPLVQLLLAVHDIKGAVDEINKCSRALKKHFIPPSIKVALLESLDQKDPAQLVTGYRDVLIRNPMSVSSLKGLVNLHGCGKLETGLLLECICLHLDVSPGTVDIWQKLASCLLEVKGKLGKFLIGFDDMQLVEQSMEEHVEQLSRDDLCRLWACRYRWWVRKHFSTEETDIKQLPNGALVLLAYKAACAAHIYSPNERFVEQVYKALQNQKHLEALNLVVRHCERSLQLFVGQP